MPLAETWFSTFDGAAGTLPAGFAKFGGGVAEQNGSGVLLLAQVAETVTATGVRSGTAYDLDGSAVLCQISQNSAFTGSTDFLAVRSTTNASALRYAWAYGGGAGRYFVFSSVINPESLNTADWTTLFSSGFIEPGVAWRRIRRSGASLLFEVSDDGGAWTTEHTVTLSAPADYDAVELYLGRIGFEASPVPTFGVTQIGSSAPVAGVSTAVLRRRRTTPYL